MLRSDDRDRSHGRLPRRSPPGARKADRIGTLSAVFVKISHTWSISREPYPWLDAQEHVKRLHDVYGPQRLMWASDWPVDLGWTTYDKTLSAVRDDMKFLNTEDKIWILGKTAQQVWPFA